MRPATNSLTRAALLAAIACALAVRAPAAPPAPAFGSIELLRDQWGVANVFSDTDEGAMYGLGYATAEDRLFQMCYHRLMMQGRMAEVFGDMKGAGGKSAIEEDRKMRTMGFHRAARTVVESMSPETLGFLQAYSDGVNHYIETNRDNLHHLFEMYEFEPEPWTPVDCVLAWWHLAKFFGPDGLRDRLPTDDTRRGAPRTRDTEAAMPVDDDAAVVKREDVSDEWVAEIEAFLEKHGFGSGNPGAPGESDAPKFSHAWVIGGKLTTTGAAALVGDPQAPVYNPNLLYESHMQGKTFNTRGIGAVGGPVNLIGYNTQVAWSMTALGADQADLFLLKTSPDKPDQYELDGKWQPMEVWEETIRVKGGEPQTVRLRSTRFGPVASEFVFNRPEGAEIALKRVPVVTDDFSTYDAAFGMYRAADVQEFSDALARWRFPSANCIFGDHKGDIAYHAIGAIPVRSPKSASSGSEAHDGSRSEADWLMMAPPHLLPRVVNPADGYIVSANHRAIQSFYKLPIGNSTGAGGDGDRSLRIKQRIKEHLATNDKFTPEDVLAVQYDGMNPAKSMIVRLGYHIRDVLEGDLSENALQALDYLDEWHKAGGQSNLDIRGTEIVDKMTFIFRPGAVDIADQYGGGNTGLIRFAKTVEARLEGDPKADLSAGERAFVNQVLATAWGNATRDYGDDPAQWNARARQASQSRHLGYYENLEGWPSLDPRFDVTPPYLPIQEIGSIWSQPGQTYTQFIPLHDTDKAMTLMPFGISERVNSPFRFSNWGAWTGGELNPAPLSREAVERYTVLRRDLSHKGDEDDVEVLPGRAPEDPTLEGMVRGLLPKEAAKADIDKTMADIRAYIRGDTGLSEQAVSIFRLVLYVGYASDYAREQMREAILEWGGELPPERPERYIQRQRERQEQRQRELRGPQERQGGRATPEAPAAGTQEDYQREMQQYWGREGEQPARR